MLVILSDNLSSTTKAIVLNEEYYIVSDLIPEFENICQEIDGTTFHPMDSGVEAVTERAGLWCFNSDHQLLQGRI